MERVFWRAYVDSCSSAFERSIVRTGHLKRTVVPSGWGQVRAQAERFEDLRNESETVETWTARRTPRLLKETPTSFLEKLWREKAPKKKKNSFSASKKRDARARPPQPAALVALGDRAAAARRTARQERY